MRLAIGFVGLLCVALASGLPFYCKEHKRQSVYHFRPNYELPAKELTGDCRGYLEHGRNGKAFVDLMFREFDYNNDGYVDLLEANRYMKGMNSLMKAAAKVACTDIKEIQARCDADNDMRVSRDELGKVVGCYDECWYRHKAFTMIT